MEMTGGCVERSRRAAGGGCTSWCGVGAGGVDAGGRASCRAQALPTSAAVAPLAHRLFVHCHPQPSLAACWSPPPTPPTWPTARLTACMLATPTLHPQPAGHLRLHRQPGPQRASLLACSPPLALRHCSLLVTSTYTANLAAFVTVNSIRTTIDSVAVRGAALCRCRCHRRRRRRCCCGSCCCRCHCRCRCCCCCCCCCAARAQLHAAAQCCVAAPASAPHAGAVRVPAQDLRGRAVGTSPVYLERLRKVRKGSRFLRKQQRARRGQPTALRCGPCKHFAGTHATRVPDPPPPLLAACPLACLPARPCPNSTGSRARRCPSTKAPTTSPGPTRRGGSRGPGFARLPPLWRRCC